MLPGQLMTGGRVSRTTTLNEQEAVPALFEAVQVTVFVPSGKTLPEGGLHVTTGTGLPLEPGNG